MTPKQRQEFDRLKKRNAILERRNSELVMSFSNARLDRFAWLVNEIEEVCPKAGIRGQIRVSHSDARLIRPILHALVDPRR